VFAIILFTIVIIVDVPEIKTLVIQSLSIDDLRRNAFFFLYRSVSCAHIFLSKPANAVQRFEIRAKHGCGFKARLL